MCGIFALLNNYQTYSSETIQKAFQKGQQRGPEDTSWVDHPTRQFSFGFHRLAINGLNPESSQPIVYKDGNREIHLICNGEIYNYKELYETMKVTPETESDCEVILHLYRLYGMEQTLQMIDGVFAFILYDNQFFSYSTNEGKTMFNEKIFVARDPFGVRPLYQIKIIQPKHTIFAFASEMKCLSDFYDEEYCELHPFTPGTYSVFDLKFKTLAQWKPILQNKHYFTMNNTTNLLLKDISLVIQGIQTHLQCAVKKRCLTTERPIACLLSGGLDSSLITALVNEEYKRLRNNPLNTFKPLETYSIGLKGSDDLFYARQVAEYLGTNHHEIIVTEEEMFAVIPEVIQTIESFDTTTIRASIGNYLVGKYISQKSDAKVIFNGDGSDELCGGYLYMHKCPNLIEFDKETRRLLQDIHMYDVLRSDKCISSHGLEPRTPFLDKTWVQFYLSIPLEYRSHTNAGYVEKYLLRKAFSPQHFLNQEGLPLLPKEVLCRKKEAFSDGVTQQGGHTIKEMVEERIIEDNIKERYSNQDRIHLPPQTAEQRYYRSIYDKAYPYLEHVVPYFWMPRYVEAIDASARTWDVNK